MENNLDFKSILSSLNNTQSNVNVFKYVFLTILLLFGGYFLFTLNRVYTQSKEINCITYYTSLGYIANGCDKVVSNFVNSEGD